MSTDYYQKPVFVGYEQILIGHDTKPKKLNPPEDAKWALIVCENIPYENEIIDPQRIIARFRSDGKVPTEGEGIPLTNLASYQAYNLEGFQVIGVHDIQGSWLHVEYYL